MGVSGRPRQGRRHARRRPHTTSVPSKSAESGTAAGAWRRGSRSRVGG